MIIWVVRQVDPSENSEDILKAFLDLERASEFLRNYSEETGLEFRDPHTHGEVYLELDELEVQ